MNCYFDTSALAKLFLENEDGSETVTKLVNNSANIVWVLELARIEFHSAVYRRYRTGELNDAMLQIVLGGFDEQFRMFRIEPMTSVLVKTRLMLCCSAMVKRRGYGHWMHCNWAAFL